MVSILIGKWNIYYTYPCKQRLEKVEYICLNFKELTNYLTMCYMQKYKLILYRNDNPGCCSPEQDRGEDKVENLRLV